MVPDTETVATAIIVTLPAGVLPGGLMFRSPSMKIKLSGSGFQTKGVVAPGVLLTLVMFRL